MDVWNKPKGNGYTWIYVTQSPYEQLVKVQVMAVLVAELQLKLALLVLMMMKKKILEPPLHPYVLFVKFEKKKLQ